ncbi:hypothetical protein LSH36_115g06036 [Paralvinella palmiformis]|uniref:G protein alpha subunit n=1 Tax=Paralvinella palmiformis TaxID=53620 RepID=A0AAD9JZX3_9ANNE|nr:hypothetical protein LSH36_115g06036 [Paralvinella palmiformis]
MFDVGGQRSERRKWIQCFDDVRSVLFVAALSGYDMTLLEDPSVNRMEESLRLFRQISNTYFFRNISMILFLNKYDLFCDKILYSERHLKYYFHGFKGQNYDVEAAAQYIKVLFLSTDIHQERNIYPHLTTATDTSNVAIVFKAVMDIITFGNLRLVQLW